MAEQHTHDTHKEQEGHPAHRHNTFWINSQVSFTFSLQGGASAHMRRALHLDELNEFLRANGFNLELPEDPEQEIPGIYQFPDPENTGSDEVLVVTFFRFTEEGAPPVVLQEADWSNHRGTQSPPLSKTPVVRLVDLVNVAMADLARKRKKGGNTGAQDGNKRALILDPDIPITSAAPHWLCGASDHVTTGCPLMPPIPLSSDKRCSSSHGLWPISLPEIPRELKSMQGDGVTVIVMDTLPPRGHIKRAAQAAGSHNLLLLDLIDNVKFTYPNLAEDIDHPGPLQPGTGKSVEGDFMSFHMPDHGLFVAGIIRSLAPDANVECIRILSDLGAGATENLIEQLQCIQQRASKGGDLHNRNVVINLSLVTPSDEDMVTSHLDLVQARKGLRDAIKSLASRKVMFVASAGNEGDPRVMGKGKPHPDSLYPAAFAYPYTYNNKKHEGVDNMVPVGAVKRDQQAASYSCYPGESGVAAYGGEIPHLYGQEGMKKVHTDDIDAPIGVYTQLYYPALSKNDSEATYPAPNAHGWAYWIGTSFATPIVAAVTARAFELHNISGSATPIRDYIINGAATVATSWTHGKGTMQGRTIRAVQCSPTSG